MKKWILALGTLSLAGAACDPVVLEPLDGAQGPVIPATPVGGDGGNVVLAMRASSVHWDAKGDYLPEERPPCDNPEALMLFFSTDTQACLDPVLAPRCLGIGPFWQEVIIIPPELAHPGLVDLTDPRIVESASGTFPSGTTTCGGGGYVGKGRSGTIELIGDLSTTLSVKVMGVQSIGSGAIINDVPQGTILVDGTYTGDFCGMSLPAYPATPALALRGADLPAGPPGTATPDPDALVVFLGTLPDTCEDPWAAADCTTASRLMFTLPVALQKPGVISLSDPAIAAARIRPASDGSSTCELPGGPFTSGTIEILSSDAGAITFKVYQSYSEEVTGATTPFDGLYSATICP